MSPSRRRKTSVRRKAPTPDELAELEPEAEELPVLEPAEEDEAASPVSVRCAPAGTAGYDLEVTIDVPEMPKDAVGPAVDPPLRRVIAESASALRWRRVLVQFPGQALIGSAVKDLVGRILAEAKPSKVVVQRGYG